jgi:hypothetical protein
MINITLTFVRTWRPSLGLADDFDIQFQGCLSVSTPHPQTQVSSAVTMVFFLFTRRLLDGEVLGRWQRILLRREARLTLVLKWFDTTHWYSTFVCPPPLADRRFERITARTR